LGEVDDFRGTFTGNIKTNYLNAEQQSHWLIGRISRGQSACAMR